MIGRDESIELPIPQLHRQIGPDILDSKPKVGAYQFSILPHPFKSLPKTFPPRSQRKSRPVRLYERQILLVRDRPLKQKLQPLLVGQVQPCGRVLLPEPPDEAEGRVAKSQGEPEPVHPPCSAHAHVRRTQTADDRNAFELFARQRRCTGKRIWSASRYSLCTVALLANIPRDQWVNEFSVPERYNDPAQGALRGLRCPLGDPGVFVQDAVSSSPFRVCRQR